MSCSEPFDYMRFISSVLRLKGVLLLVLLTATSLFGCNDQNRSTGKNTSKILVKVNGNEITASQLDAELWHASGMQEEGGVTQQAMRKQVLETLIDRQLLLDEAVHNKIDRDPKVIQLIERFKTQVIVQAYLESKAANQDKPSKEEIDDYFQSHPELFAHRKILDIQQLSIASQDFSVALKVAMDSAKSLDQVAAWLDTKKIAYVKTVLSYTSADMPSEIVSKLQKLGRNHLFVLKDGERDLLCALTDLRESPVTPAVATSQIVRYLFNKKMQKVAGSEIARLRSSAKLDYVDKSAAVEEESPSSAALPGMPSMTVGNQNGGRDVAELK